MCGPTKHPARHDNLQMERSCATRCGFLDCAELARTTERRSGMATSASPRGAMIVACLAMLTAACGGATPEPPSAAAGGGTEQRTMTKSQRFDALDISVVLKSNRVASGKSLYSRLIVDNASDTAVVDPACWIGTGAYALVPVSDPDAEVWVQPVADCGGPYAMKPGFHAEYSGPDFPAHTKYGDPLPPGEYLAVLEIRGLSQRLEYPVTVTP